MTSYVESLVFYDTARHLPAGIVALPVRGLVDTSACLLDLQNEERARAPNNKDFAVIEKVTQLFREALYRLNTLNAADIASFTFDRRVAARPGLSLSH